VIAPVHKSSFDFELPEERIAKFPLEKRDSSKLLTYKNGAIVEDVFLNLASHLPAQSRLVVNNARVIPARLYFKRKTGALIEVLLLDPARPSNYEEVFTQTSSCTWHCIIGNLKKWKEGEEVFFEANETLLRARLISREKREVELTWQNGKTFTDLLAEIGELPLPPYLNRKAEQADYRTYQTVFAKNDGSVAAPTAGLHFTDDVFTTLEAKNIATTELTLHVGAGTFLPVKHENVLEHEMHLEHFNVSLAALKELYKASQRVAVGTTSLRVLESLYWLGFRLAQKEELGIVQKLEPYEKKPKGFTFNQALEELINYGEKHQLKTLKAATEIMILPQYQIQSIDALITNFHLPQSTLLLLIAAVVGDDWKKIYQYALENNFRFLSYGDSSLLFVNEN
jgi:S-adenosylmethionine:tRNA ribosyltransferase-isomerase